MGLRVCIAGVSGKVGKALAAGVAAADDLELTGAVSRGWAGRTVASALGLDGQDTVIRATVAEALECDVLIDYTSAAAVKPHVLLAIERRVHVVVGSSGLTVDDYAELDRRAREAGVGVFAAGNFALTAVLLQRFAELAARVLPTWEIIDYAGASKPDAPSGTARELAVRLAQVRPPVVERSVADSIGEPAARGATLSGTQVHSVRVPGYLSSIEVSFGQAGERLLLRHDATDPSAPYVAGTLLAVRRVREWTGVRRGLDTLLDL
ncbi:MAG TPA: 4-hydroxy-tetrahydrodipicolinate reductase [Kofleriaceae bacterium]|nr:4-hydroxy-tetrahydrodipicolinate reductase [Kofleriaceae bacterium]